MTKITVTYGPDDIYAFMQAHEAPHAWRAIDDALNNIRNCLKHGLTAPDDCMRDVQHILSEARARIEE